MPAYDPAKHHRPFGAAQGRRSIRLRGWDYRDGGAYFVTVVTHERECLFGEVVDGEMVLSDFGRIAVEEWERTAVVRPYVRLDTFVVMPNHVHGIIWIVGDDGDRGRGEATPRPYVMTPRPYPPRGVAPGSLGAIVGAFKSAVARRINQSRDTPGAPVWQRNYYERIIRDERELNAAREYILNNLANWQSDSEYASRNR